ncbi:hypothetical protein GUJ93_ZPchr0015g6667 [Zizania palustris]|uniref:MBD domain-containing protein n=1 Tax=Zizania palustris TaxID=103762 RepID=A0A8J5W717_ZIZPA|nr:hypothetical protein GUJ93_ZPchr0015g6667 [Zizania palustris]
MDNSSALVVILDDTEPRQAVEAEELKKQVEEDVGAEEPEKVNKDVDVLEQLPGWLPDGWIMEVRCGDKGSIHRYYTSPVSGYTFSTKMETLHYLFSEMDERVLESHLCPDDNELHRMHTWLPDGWVIEVRAGGKKMEKMYKFYVHLPTGMRFLSKENVLLYSSEGKVSRCDMKGLCDTSSEDNILAMVEFNPDGLPEGWVKEIIFRKCNDGIRKDPYYTDPVSHHVFRTLKSVISYLETGEITKHAYIPRRSVTDMYSFDKCTDLPQSMLKRLKIQGKANKKPIGAPVINKKLPNGQASNKYTPGSVSMGSGDDMKELNEKLAAKIDDLTTSLDKLAPLAPVAEQLATLPSKVVALQSSAFENQEQVRALNLAILRAENAQREGRPHAEDNDDTTGEGSINRARQGPVPPLENDRPPPRGRFRQELPEQGRGHYDEEEDALDSRFHPRQAAAGKDHRGMLQGQPP